MHGQQNDKYTEMHGQQNDKYTEMHGQQNFESSIAVATITILSHLPTSPFVIPTHEDSVFVV